MAADEAFSLAPLLSTASFKAVRAEGFEVGFVRVWGEGIIDRCLRRG